MTRYEIINPSDFCTIEAPSEALAGVAVLMLGLGKYGLRSLDGQTAMPLFPFGGHEAWLLAHEIQPAELGAWISAHEAEIADAFDTVALREGATRSSLNDIVGSAKEMAALCRKRVEASHG